MSNHLISCLILLQISCNPGGDDPIRATMTAEQLLVEIAAGKPITYVGMTIEGDVNFAQEGNAHLTPNTRLATVEAALYFEQCRFTGKVSGFDRHGDTTGLTRFAAPVVFQNCRFEDEVDLRGATFDHHLSLNNSLFDKDVTLQAVKVDGDFRLEQAVFSGNLFLQEAIIRGVCWAKEAHVLGELSAQQADFWQNAVFAAIQVQDYADFGLAHFRRSAFFEYGKYGGRVNYSGAIFRHRAEWTKALFEKRVDLSNTWFATKPVLSEVETNESLNFTGARFDGGEPDIEQ